MIAIPTHLALALTSAMVQILPHPCSTQSQKLTAHNAHNTHVLYVTVSFSSPHSHIRKDRFILIVMVILVST